MTSATTRALAVAARRTGASWSTRCAPASATGPNGWKDGARCAVALSFDSDHETNELRDGGKSIGRMAWGQYGNRVGVPRILQAAGEARRAGDLLRAGRVARCSIPTSSARSSPRATRSASMAGSTSSTRCCRYEAEKRPDDARRPTRWRRSPAVRPVGMRTPSWDFSPNTLAHHEGAGPALRFLADGRRRLLRAAAATASRPA